MRLALLEELRAARAAKQPVALATWLDGSDQRIVTPESAGALAETVREVLRTDRATVVDGVLVEPHNPPLRLIVVGAVHVAEPLAKLAALAGFAVTIVDPRRAWATAQRFPSETLVVEWPDNALAKLAPDARTAIVTLTHDPKLDDPALVAALASPAFYIGCLGSKKTHAARLDRLAAHPGLERLHGPVGLAINARSPAEIAVSILAEIIAVLRGGA
ncbi:MAG TPA: XdhC family protein [Kofleriaceae bacterium]|nr:XdhC family protein [Kofleriaceae bacterium]